MKHTQLANVKFYTAHLYLKVTISQICILYVDTLTG